MAKNHEIRVRLSKEEHEKIKTKSQKLGLSVSAFLRVLGLSADIEATNIR